MRNNDALVYLRDLQAKYLRVRMNCFRRNLKKIKYLQEGVRFRIDLRRPVMEPLPVGLVCTVTNRDRLQVKCVVLQKQYVNENAYSTFSSSDCPRRGLCI